MTLSSSDLRVGVVDDSALIRQMIRSVIEEAPGICVVGEAEDPYAARDMIKQTNPDVITLDIEMPKMNGIEFLEKLMKLHPMPVIMVSTLTQAGADVTVQALEMGALDYVAKPAKGSRGDDLMEIFKRTLLPKLRTVKNANFSSSARLQHPNKNTDGATVGRKTHLYDLIGVASSTGGVERLRYLISHINVHIPPMLIVQHINEVYMPSMVERMQKIAPGHLNVKIAQNNELLKDDTVYFADNIRHLAVKGENGRYRSMLIDEPPLNGFIASADYLFNAMATTCGKKSLGIVLSGMGKDGAHGLVTLKNSGGTTIGENEQSCLVYGMSKAAAEAGGLVREETIENIVKITNGDKK